MLLHAVVQISDRYIDRQNPESIDRQERLFSCIVLVSIFYAMLCVAFMRCSALEKKHRVYHPDPDVSFELMIAPPAAKRAMTVPDTLGLVKGRADVGVPAPVEQVVAVDTTAAAGNPSVVVDSASRPNKIQQFEQAPLVVATSFSPRMRPVVETVSADAAASYQSDARTRENNSDAPAATASNSLSSAARTDVINGGGSAGDSISGAGLASSSGVTADDAGGKILTVLPPTKILAQGSISKYRKDMLVQLAKVWRPATKKDVVVLVLHIAKDGALVESELISQSSRRAGREAQKAVERASFSPLPEWYQGDVLVMKVTLNTGE